MKRTSEMTHFRASGIGSPWSLVERENPLINAMGSNGPVVYFHGTPGGPTELDALRAGASWSEAVAYAANRQTMNKKGSLNEHFDALASDIDTRFGNSSVSFIGFSLGAYVALEVASRLGSRVRHISLVSAAAPLSLGDFLPDMAGRLVFHAARTAPLLLLPMTLVQLLVLRNAPDKLFDALFASARGMDRDLAAQPDFRARIVEALKEGLLNHSANYRREVNGYVQDWSAILPLVKQPVELWHGTLDNWAPPSMAKALADALPNVIALHVLEGRSHYSAMQSFFEQRSAHMAAV